MSTISFDYGTYGGPIGIAFFRDAITHVFHNFLDGPKYAMVNLRDFKELLDERGCGPCMRFMVHGVEVSADRSADQRDQIVFSDKPITQVVGKADKVHAGNLLTAIAGHVDGRGGGRGLTAQASGTNPAGIPKALAAAQGALAAQLGVPVVAAPQPKHEVIPPADLPAEWERLAPQSNEEAALADYAAQLGPLNEEERRLLGPLNEEERRLVGLAERP